MNRILSLTSVLCLLCIAPVFAQKNVDAGHVKQLVQKNAAALGLTPADVANTRIANAYYDKQSGAILAYLQQIYQGVDIYNAITSVAFKNDIPASVAGTRLKEVDKAVAGKSAKPGISPVAALQNVVAELQLPLMKPIIAALKQSSDGKVFEYDNLGIALNNISVTLVWLPVEEGKKLTLCWQVDLLTLKSNDAWSIKVDALTGKIVQKDNATSRETFSSANPKKMDCYVAPKTALKNNNAFKSAAGAEGPTSVTSAKFNVVPYPAESPVHPGGGPTLVTDPWTISGNANAYTDKWNTDAIKDYDSLKGNNVQAYEDVNNDNKPGFSPKSSTVLPNLTWAYTPNFSVDPLLLAANQNFGITNLFYINNMIHDMAYQYGYDELAGNAQSTNFGRGGLGNDNILVEAQDNANNFGKNVGVGDNNANFAPASDGQKGRMQMYLWNVSRLKILSFSAPADLAGPMATIEGAVSENNKLADIGTITADVVYYNDVSLTTHKACVSASNNSQLAGKIALIDRGGCSFAIKIKKAQLAGAIAVIMGDSLTSGSVLVTMIATPLDNTITIPAVFVVYEDAQRIRNDLALSLKVTATLAPGARIDGDLDNGVISHEHMHGISNRLTGGPQTVSCLNNGEQMGEGWSDYNTLMMTTDWANATVNDGALPKPIGNYVVGLTPEYSGIRSYPYSTDFAIDPWTYDSLRVDTSLHDNTCLGSIVLTNNLLYYVGEVWCSTLWDMTWELNKAYGINTNFFDNTNNEAGGNTIAMNLVMTGMKLQKCSPGCIDGRDGILKADTLLYGGKYSPIIWKTFARRGLGDGASQGTNACKIKDLTASYDLPAVLPVTFGNFTAEKINNTALLKWTTVTESNTDKFVVERSTDGRTYKEVGSVKAAGNSSTTQSYQYTDNAPVKGNDIYRIRQVDRDGKYNYSDLRSLSFDELKKLISITPNPARDKVVITIRGNTKILQVKVLNSIGQQVASYTISGESMPLDVSKLAKGVYYITITGEGINTKEKVVIQ